MNLGLKDKVAVVLAASKGLGRAAAEKLAAEGCKLAICSRDANKISAAAKEIEKKYGTDVFHMAVDVGDRVQIERFIGETEKNLGGVDILVTNAGGPPVSDFEGSSDEEWQKWYDITFMSVVRSVRAVMPLMKKQKWGRIINITSVSVKAPVENLIYSNALRLAVVGLAKSLSRELGPHGITVHNVAPGYHLTDGLERIIKKKVEQGQAREEVLKNFSKNVPLGRIANADELAGLIAFLASEQASYMSGTTIQVEGGMYGGVL